jgi:hypothetical protein
MLALVSASSGQTYNLSEPPKTGENFQISMETTLKGVMKIKKGDQKSDIQLSARNQHIYFEKILGVQKGVVRKSARHYDKALCVAVIGNQKSERTLRDERKLMVAQRLEDNLLCYSPAGPLTNTELEVVSEHFDSLHVSGMLPEKEVAIEETWKISNRSAQALCLFDGLVDHDLTAKLKEVKEGMAVITIEGKASGIELGAMAKLEISASARYDLLNHRLVFIEWKQKDQRDQGPASPATEVETTTKVKREALLEEPAELSKTALVAVPAEDDPPGLLKQLAFNDAKERFSLLYARDWHIVGQTDNHVVLRLLDRGDFVAQATITYWNKMDAGKHMGVEEFRKLTSESPGWVMQEVVEAGEIPSDPGRWLYRLAARGDLDGIRVVQNFFILAGPKGDQMIVTITMKPTSAGKIGTKDVSLVNAIDFPKK